MTVTCFCTQGLISSLSPRALASPLAFHQSSSRTDTVSAGSGSESSSEQLSTSTHVLETRDYHRPLDFIYEPPSTWGFVFDKEEVFEYTRDLTKGPDLTFSKMQRRPYDDVRDRANLKDFGFRFIDIEKCMQVLERRTPSSLGMHPIRHGIRTLARQAPGLLTSSSDSMEDLIKWLLSTAMKEEGDRNYGLADQLEDVDVEFSSKPLPRIIFNKRTGVVLDGKSPQKVQSTFLYNAGSEFEKELQDFGFRTKFVAGCMSMLPGEPEESVQKSFERLLDAGLLTASNRGYSLKKLRSWLEQTAEVTSASRVARS
ncbi:hypothetical protein C8R42DRAFT_196942 [Lentinula raphanica]|nr:hypothetical protein C8R42DRAFT_196942 [Lentinula raphanica]